MDAVWRDKIREECIILRVKYSGTTESQFKENMKKQFGFDDETTQIMWNVYENLRIKYKDASQQEIDWRFTRLIGGLSYDDSDSKKLKWKDVAGNAIDRFGKMNPDGSRKMLSEFEYFNDWKLQWLPYLQIISERMEFYPICIWWVLMKRLRIMQDGLAMLY